MEQRAFQFVEVSMAVVAGFLLLQTPPSLVQDLSPANFRAVILIWALAVFLEVYMVLIKYHRQIELRYVPLFLFFDSFIALVFACFVELVKYSWVDLANISPAMLLAATFFLLLAIRQIISYRMVHDLEEKLKAVDIQKKDLVFPIIADLCAVPLCICILLAQQNGTFLTLDIVGWAWIAFFGIILYLLLIYVLKFDFAFQLRQV